MSWKWLAVSNNYLTKGWWNLVRARWFALWWWGDINFDRRHVAYSLRDIIPLDKLKVISNIPEGLVKLGSAVRSRVVVWWCGDEMLWWQQEVTIGKLDRNDRKGSESAEQNIRTNWSKMTGMKNDQDGFLAYSAQIIGTAAHVPGAQGGNHDVKKQAWKIRWIHLFGNTWIKIC